MRQYIHTLLPLAIMILCFYGQSKGQGDAKRRIPQKIYAETHAQITTTSAKSDTRHPTLPKSEETFVCSFIESPAKPARGYAHLFTFIAQHLKTPKSLRRWCMEGRIFVSLAIDTSGIIGAIHILKTIHADWNPEVIRVLKAYPGTWLPGTQRGRPVKSRIALPISICSQHFSPENDVSEHPESPSRGKNFRLYPNPTTEFITIEDSLSTEAHLRIILHATNSGQCSTLWNQYTPAGKFVLSQALNQFPKGTYIVKVFKAGKIEQKRVLLR